LVCKIENDDASLVCKISLDRHQDTCACSDTPGGYYHACACACAVCSLGALLSMRNGQLAGG
jgi:hypothetical protein